MLPPIFTAFTLLSGLMLATSSAAVAQQQEAAEARAWISPTRGPTLTVIRLFAEGLPGLNQVAVLAGPEPDQLLPIGATETDAQGKLGVQFKVPPEAQRGEPFYFAVDPAGEAGPVLAEPPFEVIVREDVAPGGA